MYQSWDLKSRDDLMLFDGVEIEAIPLGRSGLRLIAETAIIGNIAVSRAEYRSRLWLQDVQHGGDLYFCLVVPTGDPARFPDRRLVNPVLVGWHGLERSENSYVLEPGTFLYMLSVPPDVARKRGWALPPSQFLDVEPGEVGPFRAVIDHAIDHVRAGALTTEPNTEVLLGQLDHLTGNALYQHAGSCPRSRASVVQHRLIQETVAYLRESDKDSRLNGEDLSAQLGVPRRTLYAAFDAQLGIGPIRLDTLMRLHRLHRLLKTASPEATTVSALVHEVGFAHLGRTSGIYREHFGETPIDTLRRRVAKQANM